ncbi:MAG: hypothetical protein KBI47_01595 [Armatimonadetes bacterium]|nr:hypothetical protein [Armatimonadota bacterium]MDI9583656.1 hypothetical protein [Acidobacteriota bacterium]
MVARVHNRGDLEVPPQPHLTVAARTGDDKLLRDNWSDGDAFHPPCITAHAHNPHHFPRQSQCLRARRVTSWRDGGVVPRWAAAHLDTEKSSRRIADHRDLSALKAVLDGNEERREVMVA